MDVNVNVNMKVASVKVAVAQDGKAAVDETKPIKDNGDTPASDNDFEYDE